MMKFMTRFGETYKISYRAVKHPRLELRTGELLLVLPFGYEAEEVLSKHNGWIKDKIQFINDRLEESFSKKLSNRSYDDFKNIVYLFTQKTADDLNVAVNNIFFRLMKTKWASCSTKGNLTVNKLMQGLPEELIRYVIFHEVAHVIERKHNEMFWHIVRLKFNNFEAYERELFIYWFLVQANCGLV